MNDKKASPERHVPPEPKWPLIVASVLGILGLGPVLFVAKWALEKRTLNELSNLGQYLSGTTGPMWSLAGLLLVYAAFRAQQRQSAIQQREIEDAKARHAEERTESTFWEMVKMHHEIVDGVVMRNQENEYFSGRRCFADMYAKLKEMALQHRGDLAFGTADWVRTFYVRFHERYQSYLGHYFRNLYHIVNFVDRSEAPEDVKTRLIKILSRSFPARSSCCFFTTASATTVTKGSNHSSKNTRCSTNWIRSYSWTKNTRIFTGKRTEESVHSAQLC